MNNPKVSCTHKIVEFATVTASQRLNCNCYCKGGYEQNPIRHMAIVAYKSSSSFGVVENIHPIAPKLPNADPKLTACIAPKAPGLNYILLSPPATTRVPAAKPIPLHTDKSITQTLKL